MHTNKLTSMLLLTWVVIAMGVHAQTALAEEAVVRAVIFYSPSCGHCHQVLTEDIPPLMEQYQDQLQIIAINVTVEQGQALFLAALGKFAMESGGVPMLVVGDQVLVGAIDIPEQFPGMIQEYLAKGGVDWPDIPGLAEAINATAPTATQPSMSISENVEPAESSIIEEQYQASMAGEPDSSIGNANLGALNTNQATLIERLTRDPVGNSLSILVLLGMIAMVGGFVATIPRIKPVEIPAWRNWAILILALVGWGVAFYMAYVETAQVEAVCGPVGDCNTLQQSAYARLFGILPIGVIGVMGYSAILAAWLVQRFGRGQIAVYAGLALFILTTLGIVFSIYLTFLEPFVIGATCAWCLSSAIIMALLFWLTLHVGRQAINHLGLPNPSDNKNGKR